MAIPTLTDIANRMVQGIGTATGMIRNPFTEQIRALEERLQATNNEDEIVKLNDQLRTLRAASDEWSGYDVAKQDPTAAPEWMQSVHNAARVGGDNLDLVDVGTAFLPVGMLTKGAALAGKNLPKLAAKGAEIAARNPELWKNVKRIAKSGIPGQLAPDLEEAAAFAAKHPVAMKGTEFAMEHPLAARTMADAAEQGLIEGAHGAATYRPEEGESMVSNALAQGGLAGLIQGGISGIGGKGLRAIESAKNLRNAQINSTENLKIKEGLDELRKGVGRFNASNVPEYDPVGRAGKTAITPKKSEQLLKTINAAPNGTGVVTKQQIGEAARKTEHDMRRTRDIGFKNPRGYTLIRRPTQDGVGELSWKKTYKGAIEPHYTDWRHNLSEKFPKEVDGQMQVPIVPLIYGDHLSGAPSYSVGDILRNLYTNPSKSSIYSDADKMFARKLLEEAKHGAVSADYIDEVLGWYGQLPKNISNLQGLSGLRYQKLTDIPEPGRISRVYSAQTEPLNSFGTAGYRAAYNALLDAAREGGLSGLYGLGYLDGEEE